MKTCIYALLPLFLLAACTPSDPEWKISRDRVMEVHDRTMAFMGALHDNQKKIQKKIEGLPEGDASKVKGEQLMEALKEADNGMMDWMRQYEEPNPEMQSEEEIIEYLAGQQASIDKVDAMINRSLEGAERFLAE